MPLPRLLGIVLKLLNEEKMTADQLAEDFGVSVRTIYNDVSSLIRADIPIISNPGPRGGYSLLQSFHLNREFLSLRELIELLEQINNKIKRGSIEGKEDAIEKIFSVMPEDSGKNLLAETEFTIKPSGFEDIMLEKLQNFNRAINGDKYIKLVILDREKSNAVDLVKPVDIICRQFTWFVSVYSRKKENYVLYPLNSIKDYQIVEYQEDSGNIRENNKSNTYSTRGLSQDNNQKGLKDDMGQERNEYISCHLLFSRDAADRVHKLFPEQVIMEEKGELLVITSWPNNSWARRTILSFGSKVKVLSPSWLAAEIREIAAETAAQYHIDQEE